MRISDELLDELGMRYNSNVGGVKDKFATFYEYVLNYQKQEEEWLRG